VLGTKPRGLPLRSTSATTWGLQRVDRKSARTRTRRTAAPATMPTHVPRRTAARAEHALEPTPWSVRCSTSATTSETCNVVDGDLFESEQGERQAPAATVTRARRRTAARAEHAVEPIPWSVRFSTSATTSELATRRRGFVRIPTNQMAQRGSDGNACTQTDSCQTERARERIPWCAPRSTSATAWGHAMRPRGPVRTRTSPTARCVRTGNGCTQTDGCPKRDGAQGRIPWCVPRSTSADDVGTCDSTHGAFARTQSSLLVLAFLPDPAVRRSSRLTRQPLTTCLLKRASIYTGPNVIQTGVRLGNHQSLRVSILRGRVLDSGLAPVPGATIGILKPSRIGATRSRVDGRFD